jgi:hypothetical protein
MRPTTQASRSCHTRTWPPTSAQKSPACAIRSGISPLPRRPRWCPFVVYGPCSVKTKRIVDDGTMAWQGDARFGPFISPENAELRVLNLSARENRVGGRRRNRRRMIDTSTIRPSKTEFGACLSTG